MKQPLINIGYMSKEKQYQPAFCGIIGLTIVFVLINIFVKPHKPTALPVKKQIFVNQYDNDSICAEYWKAKSDSLNNSK